MTKQINFEIKSIWSREVLFSSEAKSMKLCVEAAVKNGTNLRSADLRSANLRGADLYGTNLRDTDLRGADLRSADLRSADLRDTDLRGADLRSANLCDADLGGANLRGADLRSANLRGASLHGADLCGANLSGANLSGANLHGANLHSADLRSASLHGADLCGANLSGANLYGTNLSGANSIYIRDDFWAVLSAAPAEVPALIAALKAGKIDGKTYESPCACLVGTIAHAQGCNYRTINFLKPNPSRPAERFFLGINAGDTPKTNKSSALALEWAETWLANMQAAFGKTI